MRAAAAMAGACTLLLAAGCQAPAPPTGPSQRMMHIADLPTFVDDAVSVLRQIDLLPDRVDRSGGLIVTTPTTSGQWFEFWRVDAPGGYQSLESSLHTIQRRVTVEVVPADEIAGTSAPAEFTVAAGAAPTRGENVDPHDSDRSDVVLVAQDNADDAIGDDVSAVAVDASRSYIVRVQVDKYRLSTPERQIMTASGALRIFDEDVPTIAGEVGPRSRPRIWVPLGRDGLLEQDLLRRFARLPGVLAVSAVPHADGDEPVDSIDTD